MLKHQNIFDLVIYITHTLKAKQDKPQAGYTKQETQRKQHLGTSQSNY